MPHERSSKEGIDTPHSPDPAAKGPGGGLEREADPRVSFANERTFLAWIRTSLGLMAAGVVTAQALRAPGAGAGPRLIGLALILLGVLIGLLSYRRWRDNERRLASHQPLDPTRLPALMTVLITVAAGLALILALWVRS